MTNSTQTISFKVAKLFTYAPLLVLFGYFLVSIFVHPIFFVTTGIYCWIIFRGELNQLYVLGDVYWITKKDHRWVGVGIGSMHQTYAPWRKGKGVYIVLFKYCFQLGWSKPQNLTEEAGILSATQGRYLDIAPHEIGNWNAVQKGQ